MELLPRLSIVPISGTYADQFRAGSLLSLLNSNRNQRGRFLNVQNMARSMHHFALALRVRGSVHCLIILDRVPLSTPAPTYPQVNTFVRKLERGQIHVLPHTLVAEFPAPLVAMQLYARLELKQNEREGGALPLGNNAMSENGGTVANVNGTALLVSEGEALLAADMTGRLTLWQFGPSKFSWTLLVTIDLCTPASMITSAAIDCSSGMLVWSERHIDSNPHQYVQDRVRCCTLYRDSSPEKLRGSPFCTIVQYRCSTLHVVPGGCWLVGEPLVMFYDRTVRRVYAHCVTASQVSTDSTSDKAPSEDFISSLHSNAAPSDFPNICIYSNGFVYDVQVHVPNIEVIAAHKIQKEVMNEVVTDIAAADHVLFLLTSSRIWLISLATGDILAQTQFSSDTRLSADRTFLFWQMCNYDKPYQNPSRMRSTFQDIDGATRGAFLSPSSPSSSSPETGAHLGVWGQTCIWDLFVSKSTAVPLRMPGQTTDATRADNSELFHSFQNSDDEFQLAVSLLREKPDRLIERSRSAQIESSMSISNLISSEDSRAPPDLPSSSRRPSKQLLKPPRVPQRQSISPSVTSLECSLPAVGEDGFQTPSALDLLLASCGRGFDRSLTPSISTEALTCSPGTVHQSSSGTSLADLTLEKPMTIALTPLSLWIANLDDSMLPPRKDEFTLASHFDPFRLLAIANSLNVETDRFFEGACCLLLARDPDILYDTVMSIRDTSDMTPCLELPVQRVVDTDLDVELAVDAIPDNRPSLLKQESLFSKYEHLSKCRILQRCLAALHVDESRGSMNLKQQDALLRLMLAARQFTRAAKALVSWSRLSDAATLCQRLTKAADMHLISRRRSAMLNGLDTVHLPSSPLNMQFVLAYMSDSKSNRAAECVDVFRNTLLACLWSEQYDLLPIVFAGMPWFISFKDVALVIKEVSPIPSLRQTNAVASMTSDMAAEEDLSSGTDSSIPSPTSKSKENSTSINRLGTDQPLQRHLTARDVKECLKAFRQITSTVK